MKYIKHFADTLRKSSQVLIGVVCMMSGLTAHASAITNKDLSDILNGYAYYDSDVSEAECVIDITPVTSQATVNIPAGSTAYILGDSIARGATPNFKTAFSEKGLNVVVNASGSRSINGPGRDGDKTSGLQAAITDGDNIKAASVIIIELGTNGALTPENMNDLVVALRSHNPTAPLYWIDNVVINKDSYVGHTRLANQMIYNNAGTLLGNRNHVISWFKAITPDGEPINPTGNETDLNSYISSDGIHPTAAGKTALANLVVNFVAGGVAADPSSPGSSCLASGDDGLTGEDNPEKVYNFLTSPEIGLTPIQAAGVMGNLQAEGGFEPRRVQYGKINCRGEISVRNQPSSLCDTIVVNGGSGYGIAQWTSRGRQQALLDYANSKGILSGDLIIQLEFLWVEMTTSYKNIVLAPLQATDDIRTATEIVMKKFECPRVCVNYISEPNNPQYVAAYNSALNVRTSFAVTHLQKYGSN